MANQPRFALVGIQGSTIEDNSIAPQFADKSVDSYTKERIFGAKRSKYIRQRLL